MIFIPKKITVRKGTISIKIPEADTRRYERIRDVVCSLNDLERQKCVVFTHFWPSPNVKQYDHWQAEQVLADWENKLKPYAASKRIERVFVFLAEAYQKLFRVEGKFVNPILAKDRILRDLLTCPQFMYQSL